MDQEVIATYTDSATGKQLSNEEVLERTPAYRDADSKQLTGDRVSDYMLELVGINRLRCLKPK